MLMEVRKIVPPYIETKSKELILCPVFLIIGFAASESELNLYVLF